MQYIKILLSTALTVFAFMFDRVYDIKKPLLAQFASNDDFAGIVWCALALFIFAFYYTSWECHKGFQKIEAGFAGLFSILLLLGRTFSAYDSLYMIETQKFMTVFAGIGWIIFFYMLLRWIVYFINRQQFVEETIKIHVHFRFMINLFILLCWLPYIFISLPGNVTYDGMNQLGQWFGYRTPSDFQPWFMTVVFGLLMSIGRIISDNIGIIIIILFQFVFCSLIYSHLCIIVGNYAGKKAMYFTAIFFAIVPIWGNYAATVVKDTLFCAIFVLYFCSFIEIFECDGVANTKKWIVFGILSLLVCLIRHDGIYRIVLAGLPLFLVLRRGKKQLVILLTAVCVSMFIYNTLIFDVLGISKGSVGEMLAIPFQQTARYIRDHGKDVKKVEKEAIDKILPYDKIADAYNPQLSNPVKNQIKMFSKEDFIKYLRAWINMGKRHPGTYLQATINNMYGYFYPFQNYQVNGAYKLYIAGDPVNRGFDIHYITDKKIRTDLKNYVYLWCVIPGISLLSNTGTYTWIVFLGIMLLLKRKKYRQLVVFGVLIVQIAVCCASPINGYLRLGMPLIGCIPILIAWEWYTLKEGKQ